MRLSGLTSTAPNCAKSGTVTAGHAAPDERARSRRQRFGDEVLVLALTALFGFLLATSLLSCGVTILAGAGCRGEADDLA